MHFEEAGLQRGAERSLSTGVRLLLLFDLQVNVVMNLPAVFSVRSLPGDRWLLFGPSGDVYRPRDEFVVAPITTPRAFNRPPKNPSRPKFWAAHVQAFTYPRE